MDRKDILLSVVYTRQKQIQISISIQYQFFISPLLTVSGRSFFWTRHPIPHKQHLFLWRANPYSSPDDPETLLRSAVIRACVSLPWASNLLSRPGGLALKPAFALRCRASYTLGFVKTIQPTLIGNQKQEGKIWPNSYIQIFLQHEKLN